MSTSVTNGKSTRPAAAPPAEPAHVAPKQRRAVDPGVIILYAIGGLLGFLAALFFLLPGLAGVDDQQSLLERLREQFSPNAFAIVAGFVTTGVALADIIMTRQRAQHQARELNTLQESVQAKTELISSLTHQMRTPLTGVKYAVKMYLSGDFGPVNAEQRGILQNVYGSTENLVTLTQDFLDASKLDAGRLQVSLSAGTLGDLEHEVAATVERLKPMAEGKHIKLRYSARSDPKLPLKADLRKLSQVMESLLENAINYTPDGGSVTVNAEGDRRGFRASISDTGIGIPPAEQSKLFTKFFRASNAQAASSTGTGIGLFISKKFIEAHQGQIGFTSTVGRGTTFHFSVPLEPVSEVEQFFVQI